MPKILKEEFYEGIMYIASRLAKESDNDCNICFMQKYTYCDKKRGKENCITLISDHIISAGKAAVMNRKYYLK